jgi:hypothetical protein
LTPMSIPPLAGTSNVVPLLTATPQP